VNDVDPIPAVTSHPRRRRPPRVLWGAAVLAVAMLAWGAFSIEMPFSASEVSPEAVTTDFSTRTPVLSDSERADRPPASPPTSPESMDREEESNRFQPEQIIGHWLLNDSIKREIEIRPDGTATMDVKLDYISSFLYGSEMKMELTWDLKNNVLTHEVLSGEPKANVDRLIRDFGNKRSYRVVDVTEENLILESPGATKERHHWVAVENDN